MFIGWIAVLIFRSRADPTRGESPPPLPAELDWRQIAWLRHGAEELVRLTGLDLLQRGLVRVERGRRLVRVAADQSKTAALPNTSKYLLELLDLKFSPRAWLKAGVRALGPDIREYEQEAATERLLLAPDARRNIHLFTGFTLALLLGVGLTKVWVALTHGHRNVGFLLGLLAITTLILLLSGRAPRLSARGRAFVAQAQSAFSHLRPRASRLASQDDPLFMVAAGIFGMGLLETTDYSDYRRMYHPPTTASSGCGSGCNYSYSSSSCGSDGGGSSGSSCSSGGGSSCGGGGCGGGCGGCGGGCGG